MAGRFTRDDRLAPTRWDLRSGEAGRERSIPGRVVFGAEILAGVLLVGGSLLGWYRIDRAVGPLVSIGADFPDGTILGVIGVVLIILAVIRHWYGAFTVGLRHVPLTLAVVAAAILFIAWRELDRRAALHREGGIAASIDIGFWIDAAGVVIALAVGVAGAIRDRSGR